ncbi:MAG TPA: condensation domain-containing protein, partial [Thermoanaerobaculia bacterium]|nr:condensation domain-containing protein [Thermoanaerobaculia bacterium]
MSRPPVFVLSPPRSGSTLLRVMLAGHPRLFAPPELELLSFETMGDRKAAFTGRDAFWLEGLVRAVMEVRGLDAGEAGEIVAGFERDDRSTLEMYRALQEWLGDRLLVDKTPSYALDSEVLERAERELGEPFYIHLARHPCGMIRSFIEAKLDQIFFRQEHDFSRRELAELIWVVSHQNITDFLAGVPAERQMLIRFEDLVRDPEGVLGRLCARLGIGFEPAMARPYENRERRMTDGIHAESRMLGDVKFHQHSGVDPAVAESWRGEEREDLLGDLTRQVAELLGYRRGYRRESAATALAAIEPLASTAGGPQPLSFAQERLWFLDQLEPGSPAYNIPAALRLSGRLGLPALAASLEEIVRRHASLRTRFAAVEGRPVQIAEPAAGVPFPLVDLGGLPTDVRDGEALRLAREEALRPFDLARGPVLRAALLRMSGEEHAALFTLHHIVSDGWSVGVLIREVGALYEAFSAGRSSPLPELPIQYADFALWQRSHLAGEALETQIAYWRERLMGAPPVLELPTDRSRATAPGGRGGTRAALLAVRLEIPPGKTPFMVLLAAWMVLLHRISGQSGLVVGTPVAGRHREEVEELIGFFVNTLPLRVDLSGDPTFPELMERVRSVVLGAFAHQDLPFEKLVEELAPERRRARTPLFQVLFALQNARGGGLSLPGLTLVPFEVPGETAKFELTLSLEEVEGGLAANLEYDRDLWDAATIDRMLGHLGSLLAAAPGARLSDLFLLRATERQQLLLEWNDTTTAYPRDRSIAELFAAQAAACPDSVAVAWDERSLTYGELARRARLLAGCLRRLGVAPEVPVGLFAERSAEMVVGLVGILEAGGAYVPLDPSYPGERLALLLDDARVPVLLAEPRLLGRLPVHGAAVLPLEEGADAYREGAEALPRGSAGPDHLAYVIYTSGSTGRPKGVAVPQRAVARLVLDTDYVRLGPGDRVLQASNSSFDAATFEVWGALLCGATLVGVPRELLLSPARLAGLLREWEGGTLFLTTALFQQLSREEPGIFAPLRDLLFGGEAVDAAAVRALVTNGRPPARLLHVYGPT